MRHVPSLGVEALEARQLLSKVHAAHVARPVHAARAAHVHIAPVTTPLAVNGTLTVDNSAATLTENQDGSMTTTTPVSGTLGALGKAKGLWSESVDEFGDYEGPDTIQIYTAKGAFVIAFNNNGPGSKQRAGHGAISYETAQKLSDGTRAYAKSTESGTITMTTNNARTAIATMTLTSTNP